MDPEKIVDTVRDWLDNEDWQYEYDAEKSIIKTGASLSCKLKTCSIIIQLQEDFYNVYALSPINGDTDNLTELTKFLTMVNFRMRHGNFELDVEDGEVRYKTFVNCKGLDSLPAEIIGDSIRVAGFVLNVFGDGIAALAMGFSDAQSEIEKVESLFSEED